VDQANLSMLRRNRLAALTLLPPWRSRRGSRLLARCSNALIAEGEAVAKALGSAAW